MDILGRMKALIVAKVAVRLNLSIFGNHPTSLHGAMFYDLAP